MFCFYFQLVFNYTFIQLFPYSFHIYLSLYLFIILSFYSCIYFRIYSYIYLCIYLFMLISCSVLHILAPLVVDMYCYTVNGVLPSTTRKNGETTGEFNALMLRLYYIFVKLNMMKVTRTHRHVSPDCQSVNTLMFYSIRFPSCQDGRVV